MRAEPSHTGIAGLDALTGGGLPRERVTALLGGPGAGKTLLALESLVRGARAGEPGLFVAFEEDVADIAAHCAPFAWAQPGLSALPDLELVDAQLPAAVLQCGSFDLNGLLAVLQGRVEALGARRIVLDGIDVLLSLLGDPLRVRREVLRLREWLRAAGLTAIVTAKARGGQLDPEYEFLQYLADCVVVLEHRLVEGTAIRELRVTKYRGGSHASNAVPFAITAEGIDVAAEAAGAEFRHLVSSERVSSGVPALDEMLRGGFFRGTSILLSGAPGTAKSTLAGCFAAAACARGETTIYLSFDEAGEQIVRNLSSVGLDLAPAVAAGRLVFCSRRSRAAAAISHVQRVRGLIEEHGATAVVVDPISALLHAGGLEAGEEAALQLLDLAKGRGVTILSTSLLTSAGGAEETPVGLSTLADTWIQLSYVPHGGERNRALTVIKSRGAGHSRQVRELILSDRGLTLADVYTAGGEVLMGTLRWEREQQVARARDDAARLAVERERRIALALAETEARIRALEQERALHEAELERLRRDEEALARERHADQAKVRRLREGAAAAGVDAQAVEGGA